MEVPAAAQPSPRPELTDQEVGDVEIARYALRTFVVDRGHLTSVAKKGKGAGHWQNGTCEAICVAGRDHKAPAELCTCGIYGTLNLADLRRQFASAKELVTVMAAEGTTIIGDTGLKTAFARIVAYWTPNKHIRKVCAKECEGAKYFGNIDEMLAAYNLPHGPPPPPPFDTTIHVKLTLQEILDRPDHVVTISVGGLPPGTYTDIELADGTRCPIAATTIHGGGFGFGSHMGAASIALHWVP